MTDDRADIMLEILKNIQADTEAIKRELTSQGIRIASIEEHMRGVMTSLYGMQSDISDLKIRVDRIERRLGLTDTEH